MESIRENDGNGSGGPFDERVGRTWIAALPDSRGMPSEFSPSLKSVAGLQHHNSAPKHSSCDTLLYNDHEVTICKLKTGEREAGTFDLMLDNLSESEKKRTIENLEKVQNNGIAEVNSAWNAPVVGTRGDFVDSTYFEIDDNASRYNKSAPRLKIAILVVGTRGDVQPFIAFAKRLQEFGHHVRLATHADFQCFVRSAGVDFYPLGGDPRIMAGYMVRNKSFLLSGPAEISIQRKQLKEIINSLLPACTEPDLETGAPFRAQALIANPPAYGHAHVAEALGVPLHIFFTMPWTPTSEFPHPLARVPQTVAYRLSYLVVDLIVWLAIRGYINDFRKRKLKLCPIAYFSTYHGSISHLPTGYLWSPNLVPKPSDWGPLVDVVGFCFLNLGTKYQPSVEFMQWLQQGLKPVYFGFGSMPIKDAKKITFIILRALEETGQRGIIARGWGDLGIVSEVSSNLFLIDDCPHDWLFPRCNAVVHHGGAGTTAAGLRAGCPTTIVPFFGDQFFWGERVHSRGVGPAPIPISELNVERLADALRFMLEPEVKVRAMELGKQIGSEDGVLGAVSAFHSHLPPKLSAKPASTGTVKPPNTLKWLLSFIQKWCCLPFNT
ncbi:hypothetical protein HPP92_013764 [Vanilla planifolia]|uniref:Glycosyltransferase family 28 N-terminal domain-containing protein n=1 Tax=Vanilla planifolia TaxID=51239 RepID=A0A835QSA8_VANPL|nr:hypothetical protein HPP92_013764 [Vanilla planifolia]